MFDAVATAAVSISAGISYWPFSGSFVVRVTHFGLINKLYGLMRLFSNAIAKSWQTNKQIVNHEFRAVFFHDRHWSMINSTFIICWHFPGQSVFFIQWSVRAKPKKYLLNWNELKPWVRVCTSSPSLHLQHTEVEKKCHQPEVSSMANLQIWTLGSEVKIARSLLLCTVGVCVLCKAF